MTKTVPVAQAKKNLSSIIKDVEEKYDRFTITRNGTDKAVILSSEEFEGLMETLDVLSRTEERELVGKDGYKSQYRVRSRPLLAEVVRFHAGAQ